MVSGLRVDINKAGIRELLRSKEVQEDLKGRAERIARSAGDGYEVETNVGSNRARAVVVTSTPEAMKDEAENRTLERSLDSGRG